MHCLRSRFTFLVLIISLQFHSETATCEFVVQRNPIRAARTLAQKQHPHSASQVIRFPFSGHRLNTSLSSSITHRQTQSACPVFEITYEQVENAGNFIQKSLKRAAKRMQRCERRCEKMSTSSDITSCKEKCAKMAESKILAQLTKCVDDFTFGPCEMALLVLGADYSYDCTKYWKDSTIGNCYVQEYLALNGNTGASDNPTYNREMGIVNDSPFQCRAKELAQDPENPNQVACRSKFSTTAARVTGAAQTMAGTFLRANSFFSRCVSSGSHSFGFCFFQRRIRIFQEWPACAVEHPFQDCVLATYILAESDLTSTICPAFRRESTVDACSAPDFAALVRLDVLQFGSDGIQSISIPDACTY